MDILYPADIPLAVTPPPRVVLYSSMPFLSGSSAKVWLVFFMTNEIAVSRCGVLTSNLLHLGVTVHLLSADWVSLVARALDMRSEKVGSNPACAFH